MPGILLQNTIYDPQVIWLHKYFYQFYNQRFLKIPFGDKKNMLRDTRILSHFHNTKLYDISQTSVKQMFVPENNMIALENA